MHGVRVTWGVLPAAYGHSPVAVIGRGLGRARKPPGRRKGACGGHPAPQQRAFARLRPWRAPDNANETLVAGVGARGHWVVMVMMVARGQEPPGAPGGRPGSPARNAI